ncbi:MAG: signal recognition particle-docking protein FtsY, partial [Myxococcota bacterium]|nr:signal recognition particle-docking protein FtsY [Myxococcota bacterium]
MEYEVIAGIAAALVAVALAWRIARTGRGQQAALPAPTEPPTASIDAGAGVPSRFFSGLTRSREALAQHLARALGRASIDEQFFEEIETALIGADVGVRTVAGIVDELRGRLPVDADLPCLRATLQEALLTRLGPGASLATTDKAPLVVLVVGVNGSGKTTTIGKLAARYRAQGMQVLLGAGDTYRAGAIEQLRVWADRVGADVVAHQEGADPAAVAFDAVQAGVARGVDVVICDTAGRLQAQTPLMGQLEKIDRSISKALPGAPHEVLLVLDATIGQNALSQARVFGEAVGVTGLVLTKLDGTARGGVVVAVSQELGLPVKLVGLGEQAEDLRDFDPQGFVHGLLGGD